MTEQPPLPAEPERAGPRRPVHVPSVTIALAGTGVWLIALIVTVLVPDLHAGARSWWPWACAAGVVLGLLAAAAIHRGRGNFSDT